MWDGNYELQTQRLNINRGKSFSSSSKIEIPCLKFATNMCTPKFFDAQIKTCQFDVRLNFPPLKGGSSYANKNFLDLF